MQTSNGTIMVIPQTLGEIIFLLKVDRMMIQVTSRPSPASRKRYLKREANFIRVSRRERASRGIPQLAQGWFLLRLNRYRRDDILTATAGTRKRGGRCHPNQIGLQLQKGAMYPEGRA